MDRLNIDLETFSYADLKKVGISRYSRDPSTEILMAAFSFNKGTVRQWIPAEGQSIPRDLDEALSDPQVEKWAWNSVFEMSVLRQKVKPLDVRQWKCSMVLAKTCALPGSLDLVGKIVELDQDKKKQADGKRLMRKFSFPRKPSKLDKRDRIEWFHDLADWEAYLEYNRQDVIAEMAVWQRLHKYMPPQHEWAMWHLDQEINEAGLPINMDMVRNANVVYDEIMEKAVAEMVDLTGLRNPNSTQQILPWLQDRGYPFDDMKKGHVKRALEKSKEPGSNTNDPIYQRVLSLRLETSRTSITKFAALARATDEDGGLRQTLQFAAAGRTWRWGGVLFQPQNLPRPEKRFEKNPEIHARNVEFLDAEGLEIIYGNVFDLLASVIRPAVQAPDGTLLVDADLSAIENIVLGWIAECQKILNVFKEGRDPYIDFATYLFGLSYGDLWHQYKVLGDSSRRTISKPGVLGCGYMLGPGERRVNRDTGEEEGTGLLGYAWNMGVRQFTEADAKLSVETFRREFVEVKEYWYGVERAAIKAVRTGVPVNFGHVTFDIQTPFLRCRLPSGRYLRYLRPKVEQMPTPWGDKKATLTYEGYDDRKIWGRISTHPGKITENIDQAIARDILAGAIMRAKARGLDVRLHVHDQIVALSPSRKAERDLEILIECMSEPPQWGRDLPLKTEGFTSTVFKKD